MTTAIQWTDETWNPVVGCTQVSPGCAHCYAKALHDQRHTAHLAGKAMAPQYAVPFETVQLKPERLKVPHSWKKPRRIFVNSVSDLFHDDVPDAFIDQVFAVMATSARHTFQVLTKRPARALAYLRGLGQDYGRMEAAALSVGFAVKFEGIPLVPWPLPNVWLGVSIENQRFADERIPLLLAMPAAVRFLSCEPLLGPVDLTGWIDQDEEPTLGELHWVIVGGESGGSARPFDLGWAGSIVAQCRAAGVAPFVKQLGAVPMESEADWRGRAMTRLLNAKNHKRVPNGYVPLLLHDRHGGDMAEWPEELRVREFPAVAS